MRRILTIFLAAITIITATPALAQNTSNPDSNDLVLVTRRDSDSIGTPGAIGILNTFDGVGIGYGTGTGAGGAVTQITSRTTSVTLNTYSGAVTLLAAAGSATPASFTVTNSKVVATDTIVLSVKSSTTNLYEVFVTAVGAGSFQITFFTTGGTTSDSPVINFAVVHAATS